MTDDIKNEILASRIYQIRRDDSETSRTVNSVNVNVNVNLNDVVTEMDFREELQKVLLWNNDRLENFGDKIEQEHRTKIGKLDDILKLLNKHYRSRSQ